MGMFDKDKEIGRLMTDAFEANEEFILYAVAVDPEKVPTTLGDAEKTRLTVTRLDGGPQFEVTTLGSAIADKAKKAEPGDFPAVVCWLKVATDKGNDATVLQFIREARPTTA